MRSAVRESALDLKGLLPEYLPIPIQSLLEAFLTEVAALRRLQRFYGSLPAMGSQCEFAQAALKRLGVRFDVRPEEQFRIPSAGPAIVVANHPFGGLEGLFLIWLLKCLRDDVRILANFQLSRIPKFKDLFITVDPYGGRKARAGNAAAMRQALRWVRNGGLLVMFPAGDVARLDLRRFAVCDPPWNPTAARLIRLAGAPVVPVHFAGRNSVRFQLAGLIHPVLRTVLLPRELLNKSNRLVPVRIGRPIPFDKLDAIDTDENLAAHLRLKTYVLAADRVPKSTTSKSAHVRGSTAIAPAGPRDLLRTELALLPAAQKLAEGGELQVCHANAQQIPRLLQEIGRLRELTFRAVGEGTGRSSDIDLFDAYYEHLFVWNSELEHLVGAYRIGHADRICARFGVRGLYTSTLFEFQPQLFKHLHPALELGRSFIVPEYQKSFAGLMLLWKGIGEYIVRHPRYRVLFGAVSISNEYATLSKEMLIEYLRTQNYENRYARMVRARRPFRRRHALRVLASELKCLADIEALSALVSEIEQDGKGVPILLRQYLKLGGRLLGFNVDPAFSNSIDCLIMVDLRETDPRVLNKYMGRDGAQRFLEAQCAANSATSSG